MNALVGRAMSKDGAVWTLRLREWLPVHSETYMVAKRGLDPDVAVHRPPASCCDHQRRRFSLDNVRWCRKRSSALPGENLQN